MKLFKMVFSVISGLIIIPTIAYQPVLAENITDDAVAGLCHSQFDHHTSAYNYCKGRFLDRIDEKQRNDAKNFYESIAGQSDNSYRNRVRYRQREIIDELGEYEERPRYRVNRSSRHFKSNSNKRYYEYSGSKCNITLSGHAKLHYLICK